MKKRILSLALAVVLILGCLVLPASAGQPSSRLKAIGRSALTKAVSFGDCYVYPAATTFDTAILSGQTAVLQFKRNKPTPRADDVFFVEIYNGPAFALFGGYETSVLIETREYKMSQFAAPSYTLGMSWKADSRYPAGPYTLIYGVESASGEIYDQSYYIVEIYVQGGQVPATGVEMYTMDGPGGDFQFAEGVYVNVGDTNLVLPGRIPTNSTTVASWSAWTDQPAIATVSMDAGYVYVKGVSTGVTMLNLKYGNITAKFALTVGVLRNYSLAGTTSTLCIGRTDTIKVSADPSNQPVFYEWSTSDPKVATVRDGVVTAVSPGTAVITASAYNMTRSLTYTVQYHKLPEDTPVTERTATQPKQAVGRCSVCGNDHAVNVYEPAVFTDTTPGAWYAPHVDYVYENELMNGVGGSRFAPDGTTTRAQFATVLYRLAGSPEVEGKSPFSDVPEGQWYSKAITWAASRGIVTGYGGGIFRPDQNITREQFATMLYRYTDAIGMRLVEGADLSVFPDAGKVQSYALEPMRWAVETGLINGVANGAVTELRPQNNTTRAQFATIISRYQTSDWDPVEPGFPLEPVG